MPYFSRNKGSSPKRIVSTLELLFANYPIIMSSINEINWFPGHMAKARNKIEEKIKQCDGVIEIGDARAPFSSFPDYLDKITQDKAKVYVFSKSDLADPKAFKEAQQILSEKGIKPFVFDLRDKNAAKPMLKYLSQIHTKKDERFLRLNFPLPAKRFIVLGIPNVGKSTFINCLAGKKKAAVENRPGKTRDEPMIKVSDKVFIFDSPGILEPNYEDKEISAKLALLGSIRIDILPIIPLTDYLLENIQTHYPNLLSERYPFSNQLKEEEFFLAFANSRNMFLTKGQPDIQRSRMTFLKEFRDGTIGRISLDHPYERNE